MTKTTEQLEREFRAATGAERERLRRELEQLRKQPTVRPRGKDAETR